MRLLKCDGTHDFSFTRDFVSDVEGPPYAILSHTWQEGEEIAFEEITKHFSREKAGYRKLQFCAQQAKYDNLEYFWVDTCCINKADAVELRIAISSMFRWYRNAARCYVFLPDVSVGGSELTEMIWTTAFHQSRWFTRGWTLQELLAPRSVEFFSREGRKLGDKTSLKQLVSKATRIPYAALESTPLSQFSINERLSWSEHRETKVEEDKTYSLIGIFGVYLSPFYGEGRAGSFKRLMDEVDKLTNCLKDLRLTDPYDDKKSIEQIKGGLLEGSYRWLLENHSYQQWTSNAQSRLLWVKGDPGKGKTMLLCGAINELKNLPNCLSFFFCQGTDSRMNSAAAILRGLIYLLVSQQPILASHLQKKYDQAGRSIFEDTNAYTALSGIFKSMMEDTDLKDIYLVVDALDECVVDLPKLLDLIVRTSESSTRVKWLLSSRHDVRIEQKLRSVKAEARLNLELKENAEQVSLAVALYIDYKLAHLESIEEDLQEQMRGILLRKSQGTFLWVSLIIEELESAESWDPLQVLEEAPPGLDQLYERMLQRIEQLTKRNSELCWVVLSSACNAYRPLSLVEMSSFCKLSGQHPMPILERNIKKIVTMCGSLLTVRDDQIYLIHQSAKDYLSEKMGDTVIRSPQAVHYNMFFRSLNLLSGVLKRDIYNLGYPGALIDEIVIPINDPLAGARYSCNYWIDHLHDSFLHGNQKSDESLQDDGVVHTFL